MGASVPLFDLEQVREAARLGRVGYLRQPQRQIVELGYSLEDVHECLATLQSRDFHHSERYEHHCECDVYLRGYAGPCGMIDDLYIKLRIPPSRVPQVLLVSFHLQR